MTHPSIVRHSIIAVLLISGVWWSLGSAGQQSVEYPNSRFLVTADWLNDHIKDKNLIIVDVRTDKYHSGELIPGAVRMPWSVFRYNNAAENTASTFVGPEQAQAILGRHGITTRDTLVLYDSIQRDGGATASYVFWILDVLGHEKKCILEQGIDGWKTNGYETATNSRTLEQTLYQAGSSNIKKGRLINGRFVYQRLGDIFYQIIDVRSEEEYVGRKGTKGLDGTPFKLGHIPTAVNINYTAAWKDSSNKAIRSFSELQETYRGIDPGKGIIVYCNSGRRSSFSYYILRLMGYENVYTYEASWKEWGDPDKFFPVETRKTTLTDTRIFTPAKGGGGSAAKTAGRQDQKTGSSSAKPAGGYISCGG